MQRLLTKYYVTVLCALCATGTLKAVPALPLPFFSYGGSSLWGFTFLLFILLRIDADRGNYGSW